MILLVLKDLLFKTKVESVAIKLGLKTVVANENIMDQLKSTNPDMIIMDLNHPRALSILKKLKQKKSIPVTIGYLSHIQVNLKKRIQEFGFVDIYTRSEFVKELPNLLKI